MTLLIVSKTGPKKLANPLKASWCLATKSCVLATIASHAPLILFTKSVAPCATSLSAGVRASEILIFNPSIALPKLVISPSRLLLIVSAISLQAPSAFDIDPAKLSDVSPT